MRPSASVLALFAHPDDETFRCGGTFALLARRGVAVHVLTATRGQAGSCGEPPLCSREELGAMREAELRCSCHALGLEPPVLLDYQDGALADVPEDEAVARVAAHLRAIRPQVLLTWPPHGLSGHTDHMAVSRWATAAYRRAQAEGLEELTALYYLAVPRSVAVSADALGLRQLRALPDDEVSVTVDVGPAWDAKMAAIRCGDRGDRG
ncbi:MAG: PIG-L family deacetylase, partial [Chloroflexi bacterium]|nr:PIG-L family deacetylase [Chloroflexota bacterium]